MVDRCQSMAVRSSSLLPLIWSLHRETEGKITSHHDLKPADILVFGTDLKLADFGFTHSRPIFEGSQTEGRFGTYAYQPPENFLQERTPHGRAFDMWAMGCILIELATLVVYGWNNRMVSEFWRKRRSNPLKVNPKLVPEYGDGSFHNNWPVVEKWISDLRMHENGSPQLRRNSR